jgi:signal transduction histidine kinase/Tfp pilus assembly protein PilF
MSILGLNKISLIVFGFLLLQSFPIKSNGFSNNINPDSLNQLLKGTTDEQAIDLLLSYSENIINKNPQDALEYAKMAIAIASRIEDNDKTAEGHLHLARAHFIIGNYNVALESAEIANNHFVSQADSVGLTEIHQLYGQIYTRIGDFKKALDNTQSAFIIAGKLKLSDKVAELVRETGNIYFYFGENAIALDFFQKSLKISQENNNLEGIAKAYNNMGRLYSELGNFDHALECLRKSLDYKNKDDDRMSYANTLLNIGVVYLNKGDSQQALTYLQQSNQIYSSYQNSEGIANSLYYIGKVFSQIKRYNQALAVFDEAWEVASQTNSKRLLVLISEGKATAYSETGDYRRAYLHFKEYDELRESVFGEEKGKLLIELEARYQIQAKQKQIELLSKEKELTESEEKKVKIWFALLFIVVLFLLSLTYFIYSRFRFKSKANAELLDEIAHRKLFEAKLQIFQEELEALVEERTQELKKAKEKAEESDKLKTAFLTNMSHEIRTPMNAIVGFSYLLTDPESNEDMKNEYIKIIRSNGEILMNLINDILDISLIESGQLKTKQKPVAVPALLDELKLFYDKEKEKYRKQHLSIIQDYDKNAEQLIISTDKVRFHQIMTNLLSNAIKFTEEGSITYGFRVSDMDEVLFFIKDTGEGIPPDRHQVIFERFSKFGDINETKLFSGTGLGLAICNELVNLLGGKIWLDSYPGKGSTFYFTLPLNQEDGDKIVVTKNKVLFDIQKLVGKTILIAEDVLSNYQLLSAFLAKMNVNIIWAQNGVEAVEIFKSNRNIDIILMDIQMPVMDGLKALQKIRKLDTTIPVIINTAFYVTDEMEKSYAAGCTDYMTKPIRKEDLLNKLALYFS